MQQPVECRMDRRAHGDVPISLIMSIPRQISPTLSVRAPDFPVPRGEIQALIRDRIAREPGAVVYLSKEILRPRDLTLRLGEIDPAKGPHALGSWVAFVDLIPDQNWSHRCLYLFIDSDRSLREVAAEWFPVDWRESFARVG
jgi:hypothetical protein